MVKVTSFFEKVLKNLNKIDQEALEKYVMQLNNEREQAFTILNELPEAIIICDSNGDIVFSNKTSKNLFMRPSEEGKVSCEVFFSDDIMRGCIHKSLSQQKRIINQTLCILKPRMNALIVNTMPLYTSAHELNALVIHIRIVDSADNPECRLREKNIESMTTLAAGIAHEIGNPLNTIIIYLDLIKKANEVGDKKKIENLLKIIKGETSRLDRTVKEFLTVTRNKVLVFTKGNINKCIEDAVNFVMPDIHNKHITISLSLDKTIPAFFIDKDKIYEALMNIIKNAIEAIDTDGAINIISTKKGNVVTVIIKDTGKGISHEDLPHIYDAYFTRKQNGSGLGLMNVHNIITAHNGRTHIESKNNEGTAVIISLPFRRENLQLPYTEQWKSGGTEA